LEVIKWLCHDGGARDDIRKQDPDGNFEHLQYLLSDKAQQETETTEDLYRFAEICTTAMAKYLAQGPPRLIATSATSPPVDDDGGRQINTHTTTN
jgi:hypothetical protein